MKMLTAGLLPLCLLALSACGGETAEEERTTDWTVQQMVESILASQDHPPEMTVLLPGEELYETYLTVSYGLAEEDVADGAILATGGASAQEIAVFRLTEDADGAAVTETLETYLVNRTGSFTGYLPEEAALLEDAEVVSQGDYVALLACEDVTAAADAFARCFTDPPPGDDGEAEAVTEETFTETEEDSVEEPAAVEEDSEAPAEEPAEGESAAEEATEMTAPQETPAVSEGPAAPPAAEPVPWSYNEARLISAWVSGDWSGLVEEDQAILDVCAEVIGAVVPAGGSAYDQELAVHDWMIAHGRYDNNRLSQLPDFQENPNNDNPYGFLVDGVGICMGYTTTFQLFMDLLGIQCITVEGTAYNYTETHAWNQVYLDGDWYCVDVTWDDPTTSGTVSEGTAHRYFNVTSQHMRDTNHQWDESAVPEALGTVYAWTA